ncbi:MAG: type II CAAX prenyl endopeptidase Rce1 family protein, partial [Planctomycetota bacterium]
MTASRPNRTLLLPFALPYILYVGLALVPPDWISRDWNYIARIFVVGAALAWAWPKLISLRGPGSPRLSVAAGIIAGVVGTVAWVTLLMPFAAEAESWAPRDWWLRMLAAVLV